MKRVICHASKISGRHGLNLGAFVSCFTLGLVGALGSSLDTTARVTSRRNTLMRKEEILITSDGNILDKGEAEPQNSRQSLAIDKQASTSSLPTGKQSSTMPALYQSGVGDGYNFWPVAPDVACIAGYYTRTPGISPELCAHECNLEGGCLVFSWEGGHHGCKISMCGSDLALGGQICSESDGKALTVTSGCKTGMKTGAALFVLSKGAPTVQTPEPGWQKPISPYILLQEQVGCSNKYNAVEAEDAGECAVKCSQSIGCWMFSFGEYGDKKCRLSACVDNEASNPDGECGKTPALGVLGFSSQCEVYYDGENGHNTNSYLLMSFSVQVADAGCVGQYKEIAGTHSPYDCRHYCIAQPMCKFFSYGETNGCRISTCFDLDIHGPERGETVAELTETGNFSYKSGSRASLAINSGNSSRSMSSKASLLTNDCNWREDENKVLAGWAKNDSRNFTLDEAKLRCQHLGKHFCGGVTCLSADKCTVRHDWVPQDASPGTNPTSYIPNIACYKEVIKSTGHPCGTSDASSPNREHQCYVASSPKDYLYNINSKDSIALLAMTEAGTKQQKMKQRRKPFNRKRRQTPALKKLLARFRRVRSRNRIGT